MGYLEKYTDDELFKIFDANIEEEIKSRGCEYGWHKQVKYAGEIYILVNVYLLALLVKQVKMDSLW